MAENTRFAFLYILSIYNFNKKANIDLYVTITGPRLGGGGIVS